MENTGLSESAQKDRAVVKFEDINDRIKVYDARFPKDDQPRHKIII